MQIRAALLPELAGDVSETVCIVIDVLRATTVISTLFERGCPAVYVAASHDTASQFARSKGYVLCGESGGWKAPGFDYGNSPVEFSTLDFTDKPVVISTTNGTKATQKVASAKAVLLGAALNRMSVARSAWSLARESQSDIVIVCSGTNGRFTLEDALVAGLYIEAISGFAGPWEMPEQDDAAIAARRLWQSDSNLLRSMIEGKHAIKLADNGFGEDIGYCTIIDTLQNVPILQNSISNTDWPWPVYLVDSAITY